MNHSSVAESMNIGSMMDKIHPPFDTATAKNKPIATALVSEALPVDDRWARFIILPL